MAKKNKKQSKKRSGGRPYVLRLYVTGTTPKSMEAIENIKDICEKYLKGRYELEVIDIYKDPRLAEGDQIVAVPTLVKVLPTPLNRMIGDLTDLQSVLLGLDLIKKRGGEVSWPVRHS